MDKFFGLTKANTNLRTEIVAVLTTFFTMAYIIFENPRILSDAGMNRGGVFVATIIAAAVGTLVMGLVANVPYAVAPGMGLNAFFTYTVCFGLGFTWQEALAMVFICGIINIIITVTKLRKQIIKAIPRSLQLAIGGAIGLFIAYIGLKGAGFLHFIIPADAAGIAAGAGTTPALSAFDNVPILLALIGIVIMVILVLKNVKGAIFIGIVATTVIGIPMGVTQVPANLFDLSSLGGFSEVAFSFFGNPGLGSMFSDPTKILLVLITIFAFSISDTFDTIGTFIGTGRKSGIFDAEEEKALESGTGFKSRMDKALFADSVATSIGALFGTSNATTYVESAAGIGSGGRTGLTSVVVAILFLLCLPFAAIFGMAPAQATAPALIIVGVMMAESFVEIKWNDIQEALPAFFVVAFMSFAYSISYGIAAGFIFYAITKICTGKAKEVHPILYGASVLFILNFVLLAVNKMA
jgi:AGZA family xanthine/uracil permease-like MFS transporter